MNEAGASRARVRILAYADSGESWGAEAVFRDVVAAAAAIPGFDVTAAVSAQNQLLNDAIGLIPGVSLIDVPTHPANVAPAWLWDPRRGLAIRRRLDTREWDVVLVNLPGVEYGASPLIWGRRGAATAAIMHLHQSVSTTGSGRPLSRLRDRMIAPVLRTLDEAWVISPRGVNDIVRTWGLDPARCSVLPLLARRPRRIARAQARAELDLPPEQRIIGIFGRVELGQKGHDVFVQAAARLAQWDPELRFMVVGDGPDLALVAELVDAEHLSDRFLFPGTVRPLDVALGALDAIAIPSRFEGLPLVALEAIGAAVPGVASAVDGLTAIWPLAWTVEPDDPRALAERLREVLECPQEQKEMRLHEAEALAARCLTNDLASELEVRVRDLLRRRRTETTRDAT